MSSTSCDRHAQADVQTVKDMTVGFLPLDTRPCTYDLPVQLARQSGAQVLLPPQGLVAPYKQASDTAALARWLEETAPGRSAAGFGAHPPESAVRPYLFIQRADAHLHQHP